MTRIGIIGGSGLYAIEGLEGAEWVRVESPWGHPSDDVLTGEYAGVPIAFLPRHGRGHVQSPTSINYRANIDALKRLGVTDVVSVSAVGSFRDEMAPGDFVLVDQFIDRTVNREKTFFGAGCVAHVSIADPVCARLQGALIGAAEAEGIRCAPARHLSGDGRAAVLDTGREPDVPRGLGLRRHRHDQHARGQARPRGRALLRHRRHGD